MPDLLLFLWLLSMDVESVDMVIDEIYNHWIGTEITVACKTRFVAPKHLRFYFKIDPL